MTTDSSDYFAEPDDSIDRWGRTVADCAAEPIVEPPEWHDELDLAAALLYPAPPEPETEPEAG